MDNCPQRFHALASLGTHLKVRESRHRQAPRQALPDATTASPPKAINFYAYRAVSADTPVAFDSEDAADLVGILLFLHHDVMGISCPRANDVSVIRRYNITMHNHVGSLPTGHTFARFVPFEDGQSVDGKFPQASNVGCVYPSKSWYDHEYLGATYLSFPGACHTRPLAQQDESCRMALPGGQCSSPDGTSSCTWHAEPIGEMAVADLSAVYTRLKEKERCWKSSTWEWTAEAHWDQRADSGLGETCFWNGRSDASRNAERVEQLDRLFTRKYPDIPGDKPPPPCDAIAYQAVDQVESVAEDLD